KSCGQTNAHRRAATVLGPVRRAPRLTTPSVCRPALRRAGLRVARAVVPRPLALPADDLRSAGLRAQQPDHRHAVDGVAPASTRRTARCAVSVDPLQLRTVFERHGGRFTIEPPEPTHGT